MVEAVYAIDDFPADDLLWRIEWIGGTTFSNVEKKGDYDSEGRAIMTRAELEKWFTIYVAKVYANTFHNGIKTTPLAKYKEGILGTDSHPGIGLPDRVSEPNKSPTPPSNCGPWDKSKPSGHAIPFFLASLSNALQS